MYTKSLIQQRLELIHMVENFRNDINEKMDKYIIEDAFFGISSTGAYEATRGYFIESKKFDDLESATRNMRPDQYIHVLENKEFVLGDIVSQLSNCPEEAHVYDVEFLSKIR